MALRLIEAVLPDRKDEISKLLKDLSIDITFGGVLGETITVRILTSSESVESILDLLDKRFSRYVCFNVVVLAVEAMLPRPSERSNGSDEGVEPKNELSENSKRISREELYHDIADNVDLSSTYIVMVILSAIVAAIGLINDNTAVVIGAMVIAPLLGPNVALSLATTLGDMELAKKALKTNILGLFVAFSFAVVIGFTLHVDVNINEIMSRTQVELIDVVLALASGCAGVIAVTSGVSATLIGVMVAVALMPPIIVFGLLIGSQNTTLALGALMLLCVNLICINLSGVVTFLLQGIRPNEWWAVKKAKTATRIALFIWAVLLIVLIWMIWASHGG